VKKLFVFDIDDFGVNRLLSESPTTCVFETHRHYTFNVVGSGLSITEQISVSYRTWVSVTGYAFFSTNDDVWCQN
jgi:hypothetical protein